MASIYRIKDKNGKSKSWRAIIRLDDYPSASRNFKRQQEAIDWATDTERRIKIGDYNFEEKKKKQTYKELLERITLDGVLQHRRSLKNVKAQYDYWKNRLGAYGLRYITPELIAKERQLFANTPTHKGSNPLPSTVNRYMATLASTLTYGTV
jgi:hypothetical protein